MARKPRRRGAGSNSPRAGRGRRIRRRRQTPGVTKNTYTRERATIPLMRPLQIIPKQVTDTGSPKSSWTDNLIAFGMIVMKIFLTAIHVEHPPPEVAKALKIKKGYKAVTSAAVGAVQCFLLGPEDLLFSSPYAEDYPVRVGASSTEFHSKCDWGQGRIASLSVNITPGAKMYELAGRVVVSIVSMTKDEGLEYIPGIPGGAWKRPDMLTFYQVEQMPGSMTFPLRKNIRVNWRPKKDDYANEFVSIGCHDNLSAIKVTSPRGGTLTVKVFVAYQDFSSNEGSAGQLYAPVEAMIHVDVQGRVEFRERITPFVWIREHVQSAMESSTVALTLKPYQAIALAEDAVVQHKGRFWMRGHDVPELSHLNFTDEDDEEMVIVQANSLRVC